MFLKNSNNYQDLGKLPDFLRLDKTSSNYEVLILPVGYSLELLFLGCAILRPKKILLVFTEETKRMREVVKKHLFSVVEGVEVEERFLDKASLVDAFNTTKIFLENSGIKKNKIAIDISSTTIAMSSGLQMAALNFGIDLYYIWQDVVPSSIGMQADWGMETLQKIPTGEEFQKLREYSPFLEADVPNGIRDPQEILSLLLAKKEASLKMRRF